MRKHIFFNLFILITINTVNGQINFDMPVKIGEYEVISNSAQLKIESNSKGILIPRMSEQDKEAIVDPIEGLLLYQIDSNLGFWYYDGIIWKQVSDGNPRGDNVQNLNIGLKENGIITLSITKKTKLTSLHLVFNGFKSMPDLDDFINLKYSELSYNDLVKIELLPPAITSINIEGNPLICVTNKPPGVASQLSQYPVCP